MTHETPRGNVVVTGRARAAWRQVGRIGGDTVFLLVRHGSPSDAVEPVRRATAAALKLAGEELARSAPEGEDEPGHFVVMAVPAGVLLTLIQPDPYDTIIEEIARQLVV